MDQVLDNIEDLPSTESSKMEQVFDTTEDTPTAQSPKDQVFDSTEETPAQSTKDQGFDTTEDTPSAQSSKMDPGFDTIEDTHSAHSSKLEQGFKTSGDIPSAQSSQGFDTVKDLPSAQSFKMDQGFDTIEDIPSAQSLKLDQSFDTIEDLPSAQSSTVTSTFPSNVDSLNSDAVQDEAMEDPPAEALSDDGFVYIESISSSQKDEAMKSLSSIIKSEQEQASLDGDWVALSSPALKVHALDESTPPSSTQNSVHADTAAQDQVESRIISYDQLKITSTDPALGVDPTKRESYLSEAEFQSLFGLSKTQFYALPKWKQAQRKVNLDLF